MKKISLIVFIIILTGILAGCTPYVHQIIITNPPDKQVYVAGRDAELDLAGGEVTSINKHRYLLPDEIRESRPITLYARHIEHNIDFDIPGEYVVHINWSEISIGDAFTIQVVTQEEYDAMMGLAE
jgi:mRNA-degrading endonuclease HigB of HigAB toxin-antitoxin module